MNVNVRSSDRSITVKGVMNREIEKVRGRS